MRKIPVLRLNFPRHSAREIVRLSPVSDGYLQKYRLRGDFSQIPLPNMIYLYIITPYIRMLDSDWLLAWFVLQIQALHCEFAECLLHVEVFAYDLTFFHGICKIVLPFLPFTESFVTTFVKHYQLCVSCNIIR